MAKSSPQADLHYRLSDALGGHDVDPADRRKVQAAYIDAGMEDATWDDLPEDVRQLVEQIEKLPPTSYDDPSDVPGAIPLEK